MLVMGFNVFKLNGNLILTKLIQFSYQLVVIGSVLIMGNPEFSFCVCEIYK